MKSLLALFFVLAASITCPAQQNDVTSVHWLLGKWKLINGKQEVDRIEQWELKAQQLVGKGLSIKGVDTTVLETTKIVSRSGILCYIADVPENKSEVAFQFIRSNEQEFICENQKHDFPKTIHYRLQASRLKVTISDGQKSIDYVFEKIN